MDLSHTFALFGGSCIIGLTKCCTPRFRRRSSRLLLARTLQRSSSLPKVGTSLLGRQGHNASRQCVVRHAAALGEPRARHHRGVTGDPIYRDRGGLGWCRRPWCVGNRLLRHRGCISPNQDRRSARAAWPSRWRWRRDGLVVRDGYHACETLPAYRRCNHWRAGL